MIEGLAIFYNGRIGHGILGVACMHVRGMRIFGEAANDGAH
jgi:hypothetical protein